MADIDVSMYESDYCAESDFEDDDEDFDFDDDIENVAPAAAPRSKAMATAIKAKAVKSKAKAPAKKSKAKSKKAIAIALDDDSDDGDENKVVVSARPILSEKSMNADNIDDNDNENNKKSTSTGSKSKKSKTVEETYQKMSQLEHILVRPDTYIGSIERETKEMWVLQDEQDIIKKEITYTPGLYKIYDEILVNAADNKQRDISMDKLEISIDQENNLISVKNNGKGLPVEWHSSEKCYVPTLVFGQLLTGSNFDDDEKKTTGGRNGYGAKLANIFSNMFKVECADVNSGKSFSQTWTNNMKNKGEPIVKNLTAAQKKKGDFVKVSFSPDLARFKMTELDNDTVQLFSKRAYDIAGAMACRDGKKLAVSLNGNKVPVKKFEQYLSIYKGIDPPSAFEMVNDRWEVGVGVADGNFDHVSFVNAINTYKGGEHVNYIADQVAKHLAAVLKKKNKGGVEIKPNQIKNYITIFVNCLIENPSFDSQTKDYFTSKKNKFGSKCELTPKFLKSVEKSGVVEKILAFAKFKEKEKLGKKGGKKVVKLTGIVKLDDANFAGSAKSKDCTLILTEGDSAKSLAMSGISVVGRDYYGVFPLKGKPLNVRDANHQAVTKNEEIKSVIDIMGLKFGVEYNDTNIKTLRYGHLMIMADQDHDGSHIKGLVINFIHYYWPSLLDIPGFLQQFITPIVKATKGKKSNTFFTLPEFETWKESTGNDAKGWNTKYYKGLGTSTSAEAKDYFSNLDKHEIAFCAISADEISSEVVDDQMDVLDSDAVPDKIVSGSGLIEMAFAKKHVEERKTWLNNLKKGTYLDYSDAQVEGIKYSQFVNQELVLFSQADTHRSIPNIFDGFKPSQRKVLFACFLRNLKGEMKVAQLSGYVSEKSAYHHGEVSLQGTIVNMAQDFVGSNNINLLTPSGQFGTRRMGGKDSASPRYIFTKLEKITRAIFHPDDDAILINLQEDGDQIEPEFYMPVIPMMLVNGADGIGTGWSTTVPNFNPREVMANLRRKMKGEQLQEMHPHYFGFDGRIEPDSKRQGSYAVTGKIERIDDETLLITELPIKMWTQDYKQFLEKMMTGVDTKKTTGKAAKKKDAVKVDPEIKDFKENHTDTTVSFTITASKEQIDAYEVFKGGLEAKFKLNGKLATTNMHMFNEDGRIMKFDNANQILEYFYTIRLEFYGKRKEHMLKNMRRDQRMLSNKARFIEEVCAGDLVVSNRKRSMILADLKEKGYELFPKLDKASKSNNDEEESEENDNSSDAELARGYEYLLGMKIWSLTFEKAEKLRQELAEKTQAVTDLEALSPSDIWEIDLDAIEEALDDRDEYYKEAAADELAAQRKTNKRQAKKRKPGAKKRPVKKASIDDDSDDDFVVEKKKKPAAKKRPVKKAGVDKSSDDEVVIEKKRPASKKPPAKKATFDEDSDDDIFVEKQKPAPKKKAAPKRAVAKKAPLAITLDDSDSDSEVEAMSLMARMKKKDGKSVQTKTTTVAKKQSRKRSSPRSTSSDSEDLDSFDTTAFEPAALTPAPKKMKTKAAKSKVTVAPLNLDSDDESLPTSNTRKPKEQKKKSTAASRKKTVTYDDLSDEEEEFDEDILDESDSEGEFVPTTKPTRSRRGTTKTTYVESDDSDEDFDFDE